MQVYTYDGETGLHAGITTAKEDPQSPGSYLIPANSTEIQPSTPAGSVAVWNGTSWTYQTDHTQIAYYSTVDGTITVGASPLVAPVGVTTLSPTAYDVLTETRSWTGSAWLVEDLPPVDDYVAFWNGLIQTPYYGKVKTEAGITLTTNVIATEFIALFSDAKSGRTVLTAAIQASLDELTAAVTADATDQSDLNALLVSSNLDSTYTLTF